MVSRSIRYELKPWIALLCMCLFLCLTGLACKKSTVPVQTTQRNEAAIEGTVQYFVDTLDYIGGEHDPPGFILTDYTWLMDEPDYDYDRVYINSGMDSSYLQKTIRAFGRIGTIYAGGVETPLRRFPVIRTDSIVLLSE